MTTVANLAAVSTEVAQLREVIEKQPACLVRVSLDGTLLAVNEAALSIFGAENLGQVLEQSLTGRFLPDQQKLWDEFSSRVWTGGAGSVECELADLSGEKRPVLLKGVARRDHHDGIDSLFVTIRDTSTRVRLEQAVVSAAQMQGRAHDSQQLADGQQRLESALQEATRERERLAAQLDAVEAERRRIEAESAAERTRLQQTLETQHRAALAAHGEKAQSLLDSLQEQLFTARAEQKRLAAAYEQAKADATHGQVDEQARAAIEQERRDTIERLQAEIGSLQAQIATLSDERGHLTERLATLQAAENALLEEQARLRDEQARAAEAHDQLREEHARLLDAQERFREEHEHTRGEVGRSREAHEQALRAHEEQTRHRIAALEAELAAAVAAADRSRDEHVQALRAREEETRSEIERLGAQLAAAAGAQQRAEAALAEQREQLETQLKDEFQRLLAVREAESWQLVQQLERQIAEARAAIDERDARTKADLQAVEALRAEAERFKADIQRLEAQTGELRQERDRAVAAAAEENQKRVQQLEAQLEQARETERQLESDLAMARSAEQLLRTNFEQAQALAADLEGQLANLRATAPRLHQELEERREREQQLETELQQVRDAQRHAESELKRHLDEAQHLRREYERALETVRGETQARIQQLEAALAQARDAEQHGRADAETLRAELSAAREELTHVSLAAQRQRIDAEERWRREEERWRLESDQSLDHLRNEHALALAARDDERRQAVALLTSQLEAARAEQHTAQLVLERETARIEQQLRDEYHRSLAARKREMLDSINALQAQLDASRAEQLRLEALLQESVATHARGVGELVTERAHAERALAEAVQKKNLAVKTLADQAAELQILQENVRSLSTLAAAGRLARQVGAELQTLLAALDDRARYLLSLTSLDSIQRDEVEILRKDILRAMVLSQQVAPATGGVAARHLGE